MGRFPGRSATFGSATLRLTSRSCLEHLKSVYTKFLTLPKFLVKSILTSLSKKSLIYLPFSISSKSHIFYSTVKFFYLPSFKIKINALCRYSFFVLLGHESPLAS